MEYRFYTWFIRYLYPWHIYVPYVKQCDVQLKLFDLRKELKNSNSFYDLNKNLTNELNDQIFLALRTFFQNDIFWYKFDYLKVSHLSSLVKLNENL